MRASHVPVRRCKGHLRAGVPVRSVLRTGKPAPPLPWAWPGAGGGVRGDRQQGSCAGARDRPGGAGLSRRGAGAAAGACAVVAPACAGMADGTLQACTGLPLPCPAAGSVDTDRQAMEVFLVHTYNLILVHKFQDCAIGVHAIMSKPSGCSAKCIITPAHRCHLAPHHLVCHAVHMPAAGTLFITTLCSSASRIRVCSLLPSGRSGSPRTAAADALPPPRAAALLPLHRRCRLLQL